MRTMTWRTVAVILAVLVVGGILFLSGFLSHEEQEVKVEQPVGERFAGFDDLYKAEAGTWWRADTTFNLLKERKYVSGPSELKAFLVYEAKPGEIVRIKEARQRWKLVEVMKDGKPFASGWLDADKQKGTRVAMPPSDK